MTESSPLKDLLGKKTVCSCGKTHACGLDRFTVTDGSSEDLLPGLLAGYGASRVHFISSSSAMEALGDRIYEKACTSGYTVSSSVFPPESGYICDHVSAGDLLIHIPRDTDILVAVGGKTVCDLGKFAADKNGIPLIFFPVSASSDTFSMSEGEFTENDRRVRIPLRAPSAIIADIQVLQAAPMENTGAGIASVMADLVSLADWELSYSVTGSFICRELSSMLSDMCKNVLRKIENGLSPRDSGVMADLITCLIASGAVHDLAGSSAPVRGSESLLAGHVESILVSEDITDVSFETLRGAAAVCCIRMYEYIRKHEPSFEDAKSGFKDIDRVYFNKELFRVFGEAQGHRILSAFGGENYYQRESRFRRIDHIRANYSEIMRPVWDSLPSSSRVTSLLRTSGVPCSFSDIGLTAEETLDALVWSKELSQRYGISRLLADMLMLEDCAFSMAGGDTQEQ